MGVLKNPRWERFAHEIASGKHATNGGAYLAAGFQIRPDFAKQNAQKLLRRPEVNARIDELRDLATHVERRAADVATERLGEDWAIHVGELAPAAERRTLVFGKTTAYRKPRCMVDIEGIFRPQTSAVQRHIVPRPG
jgi:hypothetical protein